MSAHPGVVRQLVGAVGADAEPLALDAEVGVPAEALVAPALEPLVSFAGTDEELELHLLELARTEEEVPGVISLRNDRPICAMPNGSLRREVSRTLRKLTNMPAPSRAQVRHVAVSSIGPTRS